MTELKKLFMTAMMIAASVGLTNAQTAQRQVVEEGGTGPFKSEVHLSEGDADNRDAENEAVEDVGEPYPDAANEEPQDRFK